MIPEICRNWLCSDSYYLNKEICAQFWSELNENNWQLQSHVSAKLGADLEELCRLVVYRRNMRWQEG